MSHRKVDVRTNPKTGKARLRFHGVAPDQVELIRLALDLVKEEFGTEHDTVGLEALAISYLAHVCPTTTVAGP